MNPYVDLEEKARSAESLDESARVLAALLSGGFAVSEDGTLYNIRQLVGQAHGLKIYIYANDHLPPHFHVKAADVDVCFTIENCTLMRGQIGRRDQALIHWWYERSRELLVFTWQATRPTGGHAKPVR